MGLGVTVDFEVGVSISLGLDISARTKIKFFEEVIMYSSNTFIACIWCGVSFLRGQGGTHPTQVGDYHQ